MKLYRYLPFQRFTSIAATLAIAMVLSLSLAACAEETEVENQFEDDTTMLETPMYDTTAFDTTMSDTLLNDTTGMGM